MRWFRDNIDSTLTTFFERRRRGCAGRRLTCLGLVEQLLRDCVEQVADAVLPPAERTLLAAEREFRPDGAAGRVAEPALLLEVIPAFLRDDRWRPAEVDARRAQVLAAGALLRSLVAELPTAHAPAIRDAATAIEEAALRIRADARGAGTVSPAD